MSATAFLPLFRPSGLQYANTCSLRRQAGWDEPRSPDCKPPAAVPEFGYSDQPRQHRPRAPECRHQVAATLDFTTSRGCGETGIRDGFRSHWAQARGGSNPLSRTPASPGPGMRGAAEVAAVLELRGQGLGARRIALRTGLPVSTVRDWLAGRLPRHARPPAPSDCPGLRSSPTRVRRAPSRVLLPPGRVPGRRLHLGRTARRLQASHQPRPCISGHRGRVRNGHSGRGASQSRISPAPEEQLHEGARALARRGVGVFASLAVPVPATRPRQEARTRDQARRVAAGARTAAPEVTAARPDPLGWLPVHHHRPRWLDLPEVRVQQQVGRHPPDLRGGLLPARSQTYLRAQDRLRVPQGGCGGPRRLHRSPGLGPIDAGGAAGPGIESRAGTERKEPRCPTRYRPSPTTTPPSSPTSTRRPCGSITTSIIRRTSTRPTPLSRAPSGPTSRSRRSSRTSLSFRTTSAVPFATTAAAISTTRCSGSPCRPTAAARRTAISPRRSTTPSAHSTTSRPR